MHIAEDYLYAFFQNCWHLCEWVQKSKIVAGPKIKHLFDSHEELRLCRDICNGTKHMTITRPSVDSQFTTFREYDWLQPSMAEGPNSNQKLMVRAAGQKHDMFVLADQCMKIWDDFLEPILTQQKNEPNRVSAPN